MIYYGGDLIQIILIAFIFLMISIVVAIFSPLGIGFIIFSIIRAKTQNVGLRKASFVLQIILSILTLLIGILIASLFLIKGSIFYMYSQGLFFSIPIFIGVSFVFAIQLGVIIWEGIWLEKKLVWVPKRFPRKSF